MSQERSALNPDGTKSLAQIREKAVKVLFKYFEDYMYLKAQEEAETSEEMRSKLAGLASKEVLSMERIFEDYYKQQEIYLSSEQRAEQ